MGGNALSPGKVRRHSKDEYTTKSSLVLKKLKEEFPMVEIPPHIRNKESFGDLDVVVAGEVELFSDKTMREMFGCSEIVRNGNVISFDFQELQVDLIFVPKHIFKISVSYFSWGDCSNLIGRVARHLHKDLKFGSDGLSFVVSDPKTNHKIDTIYLSQDMHFILLFLGFGPEWLDGFDTEEQVFKYIMDCEFFDPTTFFLHNRNHVDRVRDRKRRMYRAAVDYFVTHSGLTGEEMYVGRPEERETEEYIDSWFSFFLSEKNDILLEHERNVKLRSLYDGNIISSEFSVSGKELGELIRKLKKYANENNLEDWMLKISSDQESLKLLMHVMYRNIQES